MGRGRKKAVGAVSYDVFGNVIGGTPTPVTPAVVPTPQSTAPIAVDVTPVYRTGADLTSELGKTDIYSNNVRQLFNANFEAITMNPSLQKAMTKIGLDPTNTEHQEIFATMFGMWRAADVKQFNPAGLRTYEQEVLAGQTAIGAVSEGRIPGTKARVRASRFMIINADGSVTLENHAYVMDDTAGEMAGAGYAMLRMQAAAARRFAQLTGREVTIRTHALSRDPRIPSKSKQPWVGAHVWPKLGYNFALEGDEIPLALTNAVRAAGFRSTNTTDLMRERAPDGTLGYDAWPSIVDATLRRNGELYIWGTMKVTNDTDRGLQVMQNYGRNKGFDKSSLEGVNGFALSATDDAVLRQLWLSVE